MFARYLTHNTHNSTLPSQFGNSVYCVDDSERVKKLLAELRALGVVLSIDGGRLAFDAPGDAMTDERLARLRPDRELVLAAMELIKEWAAIVEHDGRMSRADAERLA